MKSRVLKIALAAAAAALTAAAIAVPGAAPALAATGIGVISEGYPGGNNTLYAHAHGSYIETTDLRSELQSWSITNGQGWTNLSGKRVTVVELEVGGTGLCVNLGPDGYNFYLDSCQYGDHNELFWFREYITPAGQFGGWNLVNVRATEINQQAGSNEYGYLTGQCFGCNYYPVVNAPAGSGVFALWWASGYGPGGTG
jgi:hypothetical protein